MSLLPKLTPRYIAIYFATRIHLWWYIFSREFSANHAMLFFYYFFYSKFHSNSIITLHSLKKIVPTIIFFIASSLTNYLIICFNFSIILSNLTTLFQSFEIVYLIKQFIPENRRLFKLRLISTLREISVSKYLYAERNIPLL